MEKWLKIPTRILIFGFSLVTTGCALETGSSTCRLASYSITPDSGQEVGIGHDSPANSRGRSVAQSFIPTEGKAVSATVQLKKVGSFTVGNETLTATIENNTVSSGNNVPDNTPIATSSTVDPAIISSTLALDYTFTFTSSVDLTSGQTYWLRIKGSYAVGTTNYITWLGHNGQTNGYSFGSTFLNAVYETNTGSFSNSQIGSNRFLLFSIGC